MLFLSKGTVNSHKMNIFNKLSIKKTASLVIYAVKNNLEIKNEQPEKNES